MADTGKIVDTNCAAKLMAALLNDGGIIVPTEKEANDAAADPNNTDFYICIDMGDSGVICIKRPRTGKPARIQM